LTPEIAQVAFHRRQQSLVRAANGLRYPRVGGTRQCSFAGTHFKPHKLPENAQTPTRRVHAVLGNLPAYQNDGRKKTPPPT